MDDEGSFGTPPPWTDWDSSVAVQQEALAASRRADDLLGQARARNALGMLCLRRGYDSSAHIEFRECLGILADLGDSQWTPVVRMHLAQSRIGVALYQEAEEILTESLAIFRERGDTASEAEALGLLASIHDHVPGAERPRHRRGLVPPGRQYAGISGQRTAIAGGA